MRNFIPLKRWVRAPWQTLIGCHRSSQYVCSAVATSSTRAAPTEGQTSQQNQSVSDSIPPVGTLRSLFRNTFDVNKSITYAALSNPDQYQDLKKIITGVHNNFEQAVKSTRSAGSVLKIESVKSMITKAIGSNANPDEDAVTRAVYLIEHLTELGAWADLQYYLNTNVVAWMLLTRLGSHAQQQQYADKLLDTDTHVALCIHESMVGADFCCDRVVVSPTAANNQLLLNGRKMLVLGEQGKRPDIMLFVAKNEQGNKAGQLNAFLIERSQFNDNQVFLDSEDELIGMQSHSVNTYNLHDVPMHSGQELAEHDDEVYEAMQDAFSAIGLYSAASCLTLIRHLIGLLTKNVVERREFRLKYPVPYKHSGKEDFTIKRKTTKPDVPLPLECALESLTERVLAFESLVYYVTALHEQSDVHMECLLLSRDCQHLMNDLISHASMWLGPSAGLVDSPIGALLMDMRSLAAVSPDIDTITRWIMVDGIASFVEHRALDAHAMRNFLYEPSRAEKVIVKTGHQHDSPSCPYHINEHVHPDLNDLMVNFEQCLDRLDAIQMYVIRRYGLQAEDETQLLHLLCDTVTDMMYVLALACRTSQAVTLKTDDAEKLLPLSRAMIRERITSIEDKLTFFMDVTDDEYSEQIFGLRQRIGRMLFAENRYPFPNPTSKNW